MTTAEYAKEHGLGLSKARSVLEAAVAAGTATKRITTRRLAACEPGKFWGPKVRVAQYTITGRTA